MHNIYLIPKNFPCEKCGSKIDVDKLATEFSLSFTCQNCKTVQRTAYWARWFGMIKDVKDA